MIHEFRTYDLKYGSTPEFLKRTGEKVGKRVEYSPLVGFFYSEIGELNRVLGRATRAQTPSGVGHASVQIKYGVQTGVAPPIFTLFTSRGARLHFSYERFIQNRLREAFGFTGTPIRLKVRGR